jgi:hypothetical protein
MVEDGYDRPTVGGYVVTRPYTESNVGSNLSSLAGGVWLAQRLDRTLVVDWRGMSQLEDASLNYFTEFFETPSSLLGVPVVYAPAAGVPEYGERWVEPGEARALAAPGSPPPPDVVALRTYHGLDRLLAGREGEAFRFLRSFYREIRPVAAIAAVVDGWAADHLDGAFVVGVNIRTGNGHYFAKGETYHGRVDISILDDDERLLRLLQRACRARARGLPKPLRREVRIFCATDSSEMARLLTRLPNAVTRRGTYPPPGTGDRHSFEGADAAARRSIADTLADMFLLARCDALVYNSSMFNQYARVVTGYFGGNLVHLEGLLLRNRLRWLAARAERRLPLLRTRLRPALGR